MRAFDGVRLGFDRTGGRADRGRNSISAPRDPDRGSRRLAAGVDACGATRSGRAFRGAQPAQTLAWTIDWIQPRPCQALTLPAELRACSRARPSFSTRLANWNGWWPARDI